MTSSAVALVVMMVMDAVKMADPTLDLIIITTNLK